MKKNIDSTKLAHTRRRIPAYNAGMSKAVGKQLSKSDSQITNKAGKLSTSTTFAPTEEMLEVLKWFKDSDFQASILSVFQSHCTDGTSETRRVAFYKWHSGVPGFSEWWAEQSEKHFNRVLPRVHGAMFKAAVSDDGNAADRRLMLERFDPKYQSKDQGDSRGPVTVQGDVVIMLQAMIEGVAGSVPAGSACFAAPAGALPGVVVDVEAEEVDDYDDEPEPLAEPEAVPVVEPIAEPDPIQPEPLTMERAEALWLAGDRSRRVLRIVAGQEAPDDG